MRIIGGLVVSPDSYRDELSVVGCLFSVIGYELSVPIDRDSGR